MYAQPTGPGIPINSGVVHGRKGQKQLILVIDATAALDNEIRKKVLSTLVERFCVAYSDDDHNPKNIEYCMVLYRGYPNGSHLSVECSDRTHDSKYFLHWLDQARFEGGGARNHALAEGLYYASQFCSTTAENYVIVVTGSEYSPLNSMALVGGNCNAQAILSDMVRRRIHVSLICTRRLESLKKLWFTAIGEQHLKVQEQPNSTMMSLLHGLEGLQEPTGNQTNHNRSQPPQVQPGNIQHAKHTLHWSTDPTVNGPLNKVHFQVTQMKGNIDTSSWRDLKINNYRKLNQQIKRIEATAPSFVLGRLYQDDKDYENLLQWLASSERIGTIQRSTTELICVYAAGTVLKGIHIKKAAQPPPAAHVQQPQPPGYPPYGGSHGMPN